jgi:hypothetical protein
MCDSGASITSVLPLILIGVIVGWVYFARRGRQIRLADSARSQIARQDQLIVKTYKAKNQDEAMSRFKVDSAELAVEGYFPTSQSWSPGQWSGGAFAVAILLIFLFGLGLLVLAYMLIVKPDGALNVTYERRTASSEEKTCPMCAERIKAAALVCHFCGHKFAPEEAAKLQIDADRLAAQRHAAMAEFPDVLNDYRYRVEKNGSVSTIDGRGARINFQDWESFWKAANE